MTVADRIIFVLALGLLVLLYMHYWVSGHADYALIFVEQDSPRKVDLHVPQLISIQGHLGESLIKVADGRIRFITSPCRNEYCIQAGWLTKGGDFIACLPNRVSIELHRVESTEFDAIAY